MTIGLECDGKASGMEIKRTKCWAVRTYDVKQSLGFLSPHYALHRAVSASVMLGRNDILAVLKDRGIEVPPDAKIVFRVPSGSDCSGMHVHINVDSVRSEGQSSVIYASWISEESTNTQNGGIVQMCGQPAQGIIVNHSVRRTVSSYLMIGRDDILTLLKDHGIEVPEDAEITFRIPGGGDYSGRDIEVESVHSQGQSSVIYVSWISEEQA